MSANFSSIYSEFNVNFVNNSNDEVYVFEDYRLDAARLMLYRGEIEIPLPPKAIETLLVLIENQGAIVSKRDLIQRLWAETIVEDSNLTHYLYVLRKTLGETADGKPFIETFRRRGYRFNGEVRERKISLPAAAAVPSPEVAQISTASGYDVERRGNVLKLVEWKEAENQPAEAAPVVETPVAAPSRKPSIIKAGIIAVFAAVVLIPAFLYLQQRFSPSIETRTGAKNELTFVRLTNGSAPADATISPNGDYFVYHEQDGAVARLWLQQTGQSNRIEIIPPSERILGAKTFSPDGKFLYFVAHDKPGAPGALYRVPTLGGVEGRISDRVYSPVSFSPDGKKMVFQRTDKEMNVSALVVAGSPGDDEQVLLERAGAQGYLGYPAWSPDGSRIAFGELNQQGVCQINAIELQTGTIKTLSPERWETCYRMVWTHDGAGLVFIGTEYGESFSTRRDQIYYLAIATGEARRLTTKGNRHQTLSLGVSERDEILCVPYNRSSQIWQMIPSGDARTAVQITNGLADGRAGLAPLSDGRLAYIARVGENLSVWLANSDGSDQKQLTYDPPFVEEVRASPDGRFFVFSSRRDNYSQLFLMDAGGANIRQLTFSEGNSIDSTISPDGSWIVYTLGVFEKQPSKNSLWKISSTGGDAEPSQLTDTDCFAPNFSPDGKFISCISSKNKILLISAETGSLVKTFEPIQTPYFNIGARFSPDGRALVYIALRKNFSNLWQQPMDGGAPHPLTDFTGGELHNFAFSMDGSRLYVARGFAVRDMMLIKNFR